jgi:hypothetical protein
MSKCVLIMAVYNKVKNQPNLFIEKGTNKLYTSRDGEMKEVNLVNEDKVFEEVRRVLHQKRVDELSSLFSYPKGMVKAAMVALLTILFTILAVKLSAQSDSIEYGIEFNDINTQIRCDEAFLFRDSTGSVYNFEVLNIGCDVDGNPPEYLIVDLFTLFVPDGIRAFDGVGNLIAGNVALPNNLLQTIGGFSMENGPILVEGVGVATPISIFPPSNWYLPFSNPAGCMRLRIPTSGDYLINLEFTAYPDAYTAFWVYVQCPNEKFTHPTIVEYDIICTNIGDVVQSDTTYKYGQCADTMVVRAVEYMQSPIEDTIVEVCIGDEAFLSPFMDFGIPQDQIEWVDGDVFPFKAFEVYNDTSISFIHYDSNGCVFQNTYNVESYTDVSLNVDTMVTKRGVFVSYDPDLEIYGFIVDYPITSNMATNDGQKFFLQSTLGDTTFYFDYDVNGNGCYENGILYINVVSSDAYYPNVFRPSSNVANNFTFKPIFGSTSDAISYTLSVYTRWGEFVGNFDNSFWDGTINGRICDPGTFVYISTITLVDGSVEYYKGDVTLIK